MRVQLAVCGGRPASWLGGLKRLEAGCCVETKTCAHVRIGGKVHSIMVQSGKVACEATGLQQGQQQREDAQQLRRCIATGCTAADTYVQ